LASKKPVGGDPAGRAAPYPGLRPAPCRDETGACGNANADAVRGGAGRRRRAVPAGLAVRAQQKAGEEPDGRTRVTQSAAPLSSSVARLLIQRRFASASPRRRTPRQPASQRRPRRGASSDATTKRARKSAGRARRMTPRASLCRRRQRAPAPPASPTGQGRTAFHSSSQGGRCFVSRPGWIDFEPSDKIFVAENQRTLQPG